MTRDRPHLIANPRSDEAFVEFVTASMVGVTTPSGLQDQLRSRYPGALVRARALHGEPLEIWYAYRDGRWTSPAQASEEAE